MTAQECFDAVVKSREAATTKLRQEVYSLIQIAVSNRHLEATYYGRLPDTLTGELKAAGFKVTSASHMNETETTISWDLKA